MLTISPAVQSTTLACKRRRPPAAAARRAYFDDAAVSEDDKGLIRLRRLAPDLDDTKSIHSAASEPPQRVLVPGNVPVGLALVVRLAKEAQDVGLGHALFNRGHRLAVEGSATLQAGSSERVNAADLKQRSGQQRTQKRAVDEQRPCMAG
jgi:hypothetical protein